MIIAISGANGYIAQNLIRELKKNHHTVVPIERSILYHIDRLAEILSESDVVINLAGAPILQRWTEANKKEIIESRTETTRNIVKAINGLPENKKPNTFISASAIGIYAPDKTHSEKSTSFSNDFVAEVVKNWENASAELSPKVRRVIFRIGLILGREAKTIQKLLPVFELGLGGKIGSGKQPFPFVHIVDVVRAILWCIEDKKTQGIYNLIAPENIDNKTFTKTLSNSLNKPAFLTVPEFGLKLMYGEASSLLLQSAQVVPERLLNEGFVFSFPDIKSCITEITA
jgi:uncharacterized protein (TIGR01777 family)